MPSLGQLEQREHVVTLVGVPSAARRQRDEAEDRRQDEDAGKARELARGDAGEGAAIGCHAGQAREGSTAAAVANAASSPGSAPGSSSASSAGALLAPPRRSGERLGRQRIERPSGGEVECPGHVHGVVALVHARRLEVVRDAAEARVQEQSAEALRADLAGPDMLVPIRYASRGRSACRSGGPSPAGRSRSAHRSDRSGRRPHPARRFGSPHPRHARHRCRSRRVGRAPRKSRSPRRCPRAPRLSSPSSRRRPPSSR